MNLFSFFFQTRLYCDRVFGRREKMSETTGSLRGNKLTRHFSSDYGIAKVVYGIVLVTAVVLMYLQHRKKEDAPDSCKKIMDYQQSLTYWIVGVGAAGALALLFINGMENKKKKNTA